MKKTKEQLVIENALLTDEIKRWSEATENRRKEFAKAFGWGNEYKSRSNPTWEEIFVEIGSLLQIKYMKIIEDDTRQTVKFLEENMRRLMEEKK